jgi:hypothetical protein
LKQILTPLLNFDIFIDLISVLDFDKFSIFDRFNKIY